jgi:uncharacterized protein YggE
MKNGVEYILIGIVAVVLVVQLVMFFQISNNFSYLNGVLKGTSSLNKTSTPSTLSYLKINSVGTAKGSAIKATLSIEIQGLGKTANAATANLSSELNQTNATLSKYVNGNTSLIQTSYYSLNNQTSYYYPMEAYSYNGYVAQESLTVTIPSVKNVSSALGALSAINGISIYGATPILSDSQLSSLRLSALSDAMSNATAQADALLPGKNLTVSNITVNYFNYPIVLPYATGAGSSTGGPVLSSAPVGKTPSPIFFNGTETVTESVAVVFSYRAS